MRRTLILVAVMVMVALLGNLSATANSAVGQVSAQSNAKQGTPMGPPTVAMNVLVVSPSGGNFTSVQAALNSITNNSARNTYLVRRELHLLRQHVPLATGRQS